MVRRHLTWAAGALTLILLFAGTSANADSVRFRYTGGRWSHSRHAGWHRYWGGPTIGFYWAPEPVYIVRGYDDPYYYTGPDYWYSNPSFGLSVNIGGGGYYHHRDWDRPHYRRVYSHRAYAGHYRGDFRHDRRRHRR
jgi:hypothetical protein